MQEQALAASEKDENEGFGMRSFGTDTTLTIQNYLSRTDFGVPCYFIENGARRGGANHSKRQTWLLTLEVAPVPHGSRMRQSVMIGTL